MERNEFAKVFYGDTPVPPPWATDCPVKFEVWLRYAQVPAGTPADLILALGEQHAVHDVVEHVRNFSAPAVPPRDRRPVVAGGYVAVELTFEELVAVVLPLTSLGRKIGSAKELGATTATPGAVIAAALEGDDFVVPTSTSDRPTTAWEQAQLTYRTTERREHLRWFLRVLDAVVRAQGGDTGLSSRDVWGAAVWQLVNQVPVTQQRLPTLVPQARTIDRRGRHPVRSVTLNRPVIPAVTQSRATIKADAAEQLFAVDCSEIGWAVVDSGIDATHPAFANEPPTVVVRSWAVGSWAAHSTVNIRVPRLRKLSLVSGFPKRTGRSPASRAQRLAK